MTSQETGTDMEEVGEVGVVAVAGREALTKEHCHVRIPANHREEKLAEEEVVEEVAEEVQLFLRIKRFLFGGVGFI